jgi:hypothetical protein
VRSARHVLAVDEIFGAKARMADDGMIPGKTEVQVIVLGRR